MKRRISLLVVTLLTAAVSGCTSLPPDGPHLYRDQVSVTLAKDGEGKCKAGAIDELVAKRGSDRVLNVKVTDDCLAAGEESEIVLVVKSYSGTTLNWVDFKKVPARPTKGKADELKVIAKHKNQAKGDYAEYALYRNGVLVADPRIAWDD